MARTQKTALTAKSLGLAASYFAFVILFMYPVLHAGQWIG